MSYDTQIKVCLLESSASTSCGICADKIAALLASSLTTELKKKSFGFVKERVQLLKSKDKLKTAKYYEGQSLLLTVNQHISQHMKETEIT